MNLRATIHSGLTLAIVAAVCTMFVTTTFQFTDERIAANGRALLERSLEPALGGMSHDGNLSVSPIVIEPPHTLPGSGAASIYKVFANGKPAAALFVVTAMDGYSGPIRIVLGIDIHGRVTGLRILEHRETPGLGDAIESSRSDWVEQFVGRSLADPEPARWGIRSDGGEFDQLTGASITPRAVTKAARDTLLYFGAHRQEIFSSPGTGQNP